jgi:hypothetical protein
MIDWIKTAQGVAALVAAVFATMVAWLNLNLQGRVRARADERYPAHRSQLSCLGIGRHVSGIADPFNGCIDELCIALLPRHV